MTSRTGKACLVSVVALILLLNGCLLTPGLKDDAPSIISSLEAKYVSVYPKAMSEIKCVTSTPESDTAHFTWSTDGGSIIGEGPTVTWQSPDDYGDYHIMVVARDNNGGSDEATITISVVPRTYKRCCGG